MAKKKKKKFIPEVRCLNCDLPLSGKYCSNCGQKAYLDKDSFWHLVVHFTSDYFHFDGKFFLTLKYLFTEPGRVTKEYLEGKRKRFLNPIQMYIFASAIFFIILSQLTLNLTGGKETASEQIKAFYQSEKYKDSVERHATYFSEMAGGIDEYGFLVNNYTYRLKTYDSIENSLPPDKRESSWLRYLHRKMLRTNDLLVDTSELQAIEYPKALLKSLPKVFFLLLPAFALILWMFYYRNSYVDHIIFSMHFHIILFVFLLLFLLLSYIIGYGEFVAQAFIGMLAGVVLYLYLSMRRVFIQPVGLTLFKLIGVTIIYGALFSFTFFIVLLLGLVFVSVG